MASPAMSPDHTALTLAQAKIAARSGAKVRAVLCVRDGAHLVPYVRFRGAVGWLELRERHGRRPRLWTSVDRLLKRLSAIFGEIECCIVRLADPVSLSRLGIRLA